MSKPTEIRLRSDFPFEVIQQVGSDTIIAHAAWTSTKGRDSLPEVANDKLRGLISYLMEHRHGTPFEHGSVTFRVRAPIKVWREFHRHRIGFSYSEESARYKKLEPEFYVPYSDRPMIKVDDWKPGRPKFLQATSDVAAQVMDNNKRSYEIAYAAYEQNLALGVDPGLARDPLPVGIYSTCWVTCNPRSLMAFISLRTHEKDATFISYPLWEIEQVARMAEVTLATYWPITHEMFCKHGRVGP